MSTSFAAPTANPNPDSPGYQQDSESIVSAAMSRFGQNQILCGYHFLDRKRQRKFKTLRNGNITTDYHWPACKSLEGPPTIQIIRDGYQTVFMGTDSMSKKKSYTDQPWAAIDIARDLLKDLSGSHENSPNHPGPAFWISQAPAVPPIADMRLWGTPDFLKAYPAFVAECEAYKGRAYRECERLLAEGDTIHSSGRPSDITDRYRAAALLIGANDAEHPWIRATKIGVEISCPFCGRKTSATAPKCGSCNEIIDRALYESRIADRDRMSQPMNQPPPPPAPHLAKPSPKP